METENHMEKKLINASKLKLIFKDIFTVFEKHNLNREEVEFVISDLGKISNKFEIKQEE